MIRVALLVLALLCFALLVFGVAVEHLRLLPLGLGLWVLAELLVPAHLTLVRRTE